MQPKLEPGWKPVVTSDSSHVWIGFQPDHEPVDGELVMTDLDTGEKFRYSNAPVRWKDEVERGKEISE